MVRIGVGLIVIGVLTVDLLDIARRRHLAAGEAGAGPGHPADGYFGPHVAGLRKGQAFVILELAALVCAGMFSGAAVYVSLVEHPARIEGGSALAVAEFRPSYRRGAVMQATLAAVGCLAAVAAWVEGTGAPALVAGLLLGSAIPFTLIVILPTNKRLLDPALDPASPEAAMLLARWGRLHAVRSLAGAAAFLLLGLHLGRVV